MYYDEDVSTDGGRNWRRAELQEPVLSRALTRFRAWWRWNGEQASPLVALSTSVLAQPYQIGQKVTEAQVTRWAIDVVPDGRGLPAGKGSVSEGNLVYDTRCAACHGLKGEGTIGDRLVDGIGTLNSAKLVKTFGSYWPPYATTAYDYIYRAMPYDRPGEVASGRVIVVTSWCRRRFP